MAYLQCVLKIAVMASPVIAGVYLCTFRDSEASLTGAVCAPSSGGGLPGLRRLLLLGLRGLTGFRFAHSPDLPSWLFVHLHAHPGCHQLCQHSWERLPTAPPAWPRTSLGPERV